LLCYKRQNEKERAKTSVKETDVASVNKAALFNASYSDTLLTETGCANDAVSRWSLTTMQVKYNYTVHYYRSQLIR